MKDWQKEILYNEGFDMETNLDKAEAIITAANVIDKAAEVVMKEHIEVLMLQLNVNDEKTAAYCKLIIRTYLSLAFAELEDVIHSRAQAY